MEQEIDDMGETTYAQNSSPIKNKDGAIWVNKTTRDHIDI